MLDHLNIGEPNDVLITGLRHDTTGEYKNDATVTAQVKDLDDVNVGSSATLTYIEGSDGDYRGTLPKSVGAALEESQQYYVVITANSGDVTLRRIPVVAKWRGRT
jgi:hypothetical protein